MVTVKEARQQLTQQQQILAQTKTQITGTSLPAISVAQLRTRGRAQILQRESRERQLAGAKERELTKLQPVERELKRAEKEVVRFEEAIKKQEERRRAFDKALDLFIEKKPIVGLTGLEEQFFKQISQGKQTAIRLSIEKAIGELKAKGVKEIKPIFEKGKAIPIGFEGIKFETITKPRERITFGDPNKFAQSFRRATGSDSFTIAIPLRRENGKVRVQDFNFQFEGDKIVKAQPTGTALLTETQFLKVDKRRRDKNPGFNFGDTRIEITIPKEALKVIELPPEKLEPPRLPPRPRPGALELERQIELIGSKLPGGKKFLQFFAGKSLLQITEEGFDVAAKKLLAVSAKVPVPPGLIKKFPFLSKEIQADEATQITSDFLKFVFFTPAFATAVKGQVKAKQKVQTKTKTTAAKKEKAKKIVRTFEDIFKRKGVKPTESKVKELVTRFVKDQKDPQLKEIALRNLNELLKDLNRKGIIRNFALDAETGTIQFFERFPIPKPAIELVVERIPTLGQAGTVGGIVQTIFRTRTVPKAAPKNRIREIDQQRRKIIEDRAKLSPAEKARTTQAFNARLATLVGLRLKQVTKQVTQQVQLTKQVTKQAQKIKQRQIQTQRQVSQLKLAQLLFPQQALKKQQLQKALQKLKEPILKKLPFPPFLLLKPVVKKKKKLKRIPPSKIGYNVKVKSKGKFKKVNVNPLTKKKARNLGAFLTDKSTARTFRILRSGTKAQKPFLKVPQAYFKKNIRKFRGKKVKGIIQPIKKLAIEKIKFAIDSRGEKRQLSVARLRARLFKTAKKRRKKKK